MKTTKYDKIMMNIAIEMANLSYCKRKKTGCIITIEGRIIGNGYNGTIQGKDNCCEEVCKECNGKGYLNNENIKCPKCQGMGIITKNGILHAEQNALMFMLKKGISSFGATLYVTLSPCINCAKLIAQSGIKRVVYLEKYRDDEGLLFLKDNDITISQLKD